MTTSVLVAELADLRQLLRGAERIWLEDRFCIKLAGQTWILLFYPGISVGVPLSKSGEWENTPGCARRFNSVEDAARYWRENQSRLRAGDIR